MLINARLTTCTYKNLIQYIITSTLTGLENSCQGPVVSGHSWGCLREICWESLQMEHLLSWLPPILSYQTASWRREKGKVHVWGTVTITVWEREREREAYTSVFSECSPVSITSGASHLYRLRPYRVSVGWEEAHTILPLLLTATSPHLPSSPKLILPEIGRASCRERW